MLSVVIPIYCNQQSLPDLMVALNGLSAKVSDQFRQQLEVVFVVDGSPDESFAFLTHALPSARFASILLSHSRNFGAFAAIRTGLRAATGTHVAVMAADLQEPPDLMIQFFETLMRGDCDLVVGRRQSREDPSATKVASALFWRLYRAFVIPEIPEGGVDVFGCNRRFRDELVRMTEAHGSLIGQLFWMGFRRSKVAYMRRTREHGKSAWTLRRKIAYLRDSVYSFTDLPVRLLTWFGGLGVILALVLGGIVLYAKVSGEIPIPGYAATVLTVMFFGGINAFGLGVVGAYAWRTYENTKNRPLALVMAHMTFKGSSPENDSSA